MDAKAGTTYYFKGGLPMTGFASKELKRTFDSILFVDNIATNPQALEANSNVVTQNNQAVSTGSSVPLEKKEVSLSHAKTDLTIATLLKNKSQYAEKSIKIKGEVTKFNTGIMIWYGITQKMMFLVISSWLWKNMKCSGQFL